MGFFYHQTKSTFEKERERELQMMEQLEEENLSEKPWYLQGEIASAHRPQNSALEEHLEYDIAVKQSELLDAKLRCGSICHNIVQGFMFYFFILFISIYLYSLVIVNCGI